MREVTEYIKKQKNPQKSICNKLRRIILKTFPDFLRACFQYFCDFFKGFLAFFVVKYAYFKFKGILNKNLSFSI